MEILEGVSEDLMVLEFLKAEIKSKNPDHNIQEMIHCALRHLGKNEEIIFSGNIHDGQNEERNKVLEYRGYRKDAGIFRNFPQKIQWYLVKLDKQDFKRIKYINQPKWNELSSNTRLLTEAAKKILNSDNKEKYQNYFDGAEYLRNGNDFPLPIIITDGQKMTILEGHNRLTIYAIEQHCWQYVKAIVGCCNTPEFNNWDRNCF